MCDDGGVHYWQTIGQQEEELLCQPPNRKDQGNTMGMLLKAKSGSGDFAQLPPGPHVARCFAFIDLGTQKVVWQGKTNSRRKVRISWEVPSEQMSDGRPMTISKTYTATLDEKSNLSIDLESWRNKKFTDAERDGWEAENLLGKTCQINVSHEPGKNGKVYANITAIMPLGKGQSCSPQVNESRFFSFDDGFDRETFSKLSEYVQKTIMDSPEYAEAMADLSQGERGSVDDDDEIPF
jgi:hypothetical protein